jgi:hypothetical protein
MLTGQRGKRARGAADDEAAVFLDVSDRAKLLVHQLADQGHARL